MFNWCAFGFGAGGTALNTGAALVNIGTNALKFASANVSAAASMSQSIANQATYKSQAKSFRTSADDAIAAAGRAQEQGQQAREQRLVQLGQQKGQIMASAAGSGIEVSSKIVDKVMSDTIKSAYNDAATLASNEKQATDDKINESTALRINADRADANAEIEGINQNLIAEQIKLNNRAAKHAMIGGILSAAGTFMSGVGTSLAAGYSGNAST